MKFIAGIIALLMSCAVSANTQEGPFGLKWGSSIKEIKAKGIKLEKANSESVLSIYTTKKLPKNLSLADIYVLTFDKKYKLQNVAMLSKDISDDIYGADGKEKYLSIKEKLIKKYGAPSFEYEYIGRDLFDEADEFYQCLAYSGCGTWLSAFEPKVENFSALIELKGMGRGKGYIELTYEGPSWSDVVDAMKSSASKSDDDAL